MEPQYYAHYSEEAAKWYGTCIYSTLDGGEIEVTNVYQEGQEDQYMWKDKRLLGRVGAYLRKGERGIAPECYVYWPYIPFDA